MFKRFVPYSIALFVLMMFSAVASAQQPVPAKFVMPQQSIVGSDPTVQPGEVVILQVTAITNPPKYFAGATYEWVVFEGAKRKIGGIITFPDKTSIVFGSGAPVKNDRHFNIMLMACYLYTAYENDDQKTGKIVEVAQRVQLLSFQVTVPGTSPTPNPPGPDPIVPTPVFPDGQYKLSKFAYDTTMAKVSEGNRKGGAALAKSFAGQAAAVAAGTITNVETLLQNTKNSNNSALNGAGVPLNTWDAWGSALQDKLYELYRAGQLSTPQQYATAWREIASGLEKVQ